MSVVKIQYKERCDIGNHEAWYVKTVSYQLKSEPYDFIVTKECVNCSLKFQEKENELEIRIRQLIETKKLEGSGMRVITSKMTDSGGGEE